MNQPGKKLQRNLTNRHIQLIAIGGAIGTGLFMGSGKTISLAGPSILLVYAIIGFVLFFVMRAMGELLLSNLQYKSFVDFVTDLLGPTAGFFMGWTYWFCWIVTGSADLIAISGYIEYLFPGAVDPWVPAFICILIFLCLNLLTVKLFGEAEFWFSIIKILAIVALVIIGAVFIIYKFKTPVGIVASLSNIWSDGGFFPTGFAGFVAGFQIAVFAFVGVELVGTTAAETKDPEKTLPKAINAIPVRVIFFYVLALAVIMSVMPWRMINPNASPFIVLFNFAGIAAAFSITYFVVLTSAASSANSGIFSTSRMLYGLALSQKAPTIFKKLSKVSVPAYGLLFSCLCLLPAVILLYFGNENIMLAFTLVSTASTILFVFIWSMILISYIVYRSKRKELHKKSKFKVPGGLFSVYGALTFFVLLIIALWFKDDTRQALIFTPVWFIILAVGHFLIPSKVRKQWLNDGFDLNENDSFK
ncbi:amino acid permease [Apibacter muscae]|uniref:Amino acid permease n=1 Tax=Apibacter muscae TaxID=2509004 RepID=A0A563DKE5_9FLAO|nr:amino acid permease [Apibacter muscae]TWP30706.1 amino acid permease [Apibacter muscae]